jgi:hypothetical protein
LTFLLGSFHKKWIENKNPDRESLLGTGDIQSLADLGNSFGFVEKMKPLPLDPRTLIHLILASLLSDGASAADRHAAQRRSEITIQSSDVNQQFISRDVMAVI